MKGARDHREAAGQCRQDRRDAWATNTGRLVKLIQESFGEHRHVVVRFDLRVGLCHVGAPHGLAAAPRSPSSVSAT